MAHGKAVVVTRARWRRGAECVGCREQTAMNYAQWERIEELLQNALDLEPGDRPAFLDKACAGDDELRREAEALLSNEEKARSFIETPALVYLDGHSAESSALSLIGQRISH